MFAIVVERSDGITEKAVCINGKWYPKFTVTFYADPENVKSGLYSVYMTGLDWIMDKNLSIEEFNQMKGVQCFELITGMAPFKPWTLDVRQDALNKFGNNYEGQFGK